MSYKKKLIEVALPLEAINRESAREKSIRHGHPSTLHLWWARRPLAACRAVIFASLVDDPSAHPDRFPSEQAQEAERLRLFHIIEELVKWENIANERVLAVAREEILASCNGLPPTICDPFCGGGSIPLEAQRLGLEVHASDLNPVPVLITKALIELPAQFSDRPPTNQDADRKLGDGGSWRGAAGLADDIRYYGKWMRDEAFRRIGDFYPTIRVPKEHGGGQATVVAWLWARTVASPDPAAGGAHVPLVRSFVVSAKARKRTWIEPIVDRARMTYRFEVRFGAGTPPSGTLASRTGGMCLLTGSALPLEYVKREAKAGRMGARLLALVAENANGRFFLSPDDEHERLALAVPPAASGLLDTEMVVTSRYMTPTGYGMTKHRDLFTNRQLSALTTFCDLVAEVHSKVLKDSGGDETYARAIATYMACALSRSADYWSSLAMWASDFVAHTFGRNALPMVWDYAEANPFSEGTGNWMGAIDWVRRVVQLLPARGKVQVDQREAQHLSDVPTKMYCTDPPYYDNVPYADLSDFFYVWLRRCLGSHYPKLFETVLVPKSAELVADELRQGGKDKAREFFEEGMAQVFARMRDSASEEFPTTVFYAFKQSETDASDEASTEVQDRASRGWETILEAMVRAGWQIDGTWPIRTERPGRLRETGSNALASSIVLVTRLRSADAPVSSRRDFLVALKKELPQALKHLQKSNIAPVDLAQASIGPGMAVFTRYAKVLESDGSAMSVRTALKLINQALDEVLAEQEGEFDVETRWALAWFDQYGLAEGPYGKAETLSTAKNTSVPAMDTAGIVVARAGKVRLLATKELDFEWLPENRERLTIWRVVHQLVRTLEEGEKRAATLIGRVKHLDPSKIDAARDLAYRLFVTSEKRKRAAEALGYNALVAAWPDLMKLAESPTQVTSQAGLL